MTRFIESFIYNMLPITKQNGKCWHQNNICCMEFKGYLNQNLFPMNGPIVIVEGIELFMTET